jgi:iron(III) transport system substrate-binding protein
VRGRNSEGAGRFGVARLTACLAVTALGLSGLAGCGGSSDQLVVYSGRTGDLITPLLEQFAEETGVDIDVDYQDSADLALLLDEEGDSTQADVFISQSPGAIGFLDEQGRLAQLPEDILGMVPEGDAAENGSWVGLSGRVRTLVYNTDEVDPATLPESVLDLAGDEYAGQVAVAPSNASFLDFVTVLRQRVGEQETEAFLTALADGGAPTYADNHAIVEAVGRGEVPMGLVNHYYAFRALDEDPDLPVENYYFPEGDYGSTLLVTAASIVEGSDQAEDARRLVEFLLSTEAQEYFSQETFEYPLASGVEPDSTLPPFEEISATRVDMSELGGGLEATTELIDASGLNS